MRRYMAILILGTMLIAYPAAAQVWRTIELPDGPGSEGPPVILDVVMDGEVLWASTRFDGIMACDGSQWVVHEVADGGLRSNAFRYVMFVDSEGVKFTAKDGAPTVDRLDDAGTLFDKSDDMWRYYSTGSQLVSGRVFSMLQDSRGNYWFGIRDEGGTELTTLELLLEGDPSTQDDDQWLSYNTHPDTLALASDDVRGLALGKDDRLWVFYGREDGIDAWAFGDYESYDDDVLTHYGQVDGLPSDKVWDIHVADDGRVWAGTDGGLAVFTPSSGVWEQVEGMPGERVNDITTDAQGHIWAATDEAVVMLFGSGEIAYVHSIYDPEDPARRHEIERVEVGRQDGRVWAVSLNPSTGRTFVNVLGSGFGPDRRIAVYPNPWREPEADGPMRIIGVPDGSEVKAYDLTGELVRELPGTREPYEWDSLDSDLNEVPSGVYIIGVETPDGDQIFTKVAIIR